MPYYRFIVPSLLFFAGVLFISSCYRSVDSYRKEYRDPALFGEWLNPDGVEEIRRDSLLIERGGLSCDHRSYIVGMNYLPNGDAICLYAVYEEGSVKPTLERKRSAVYYTKDNKLYQVSHGFKGSAPSHVVEGYEVKGDTLYMKSTDPQGLKWLRVYKRQKVTADMLPKRPAPKDK